MTIVSSDSARGQGRAHDGVQAGMLLVGISSAVYPRFSYDYLLSSRSSCHCHSFHQSLIRICHLARNTHSPTPSPFASNRKAMLFSSISALLLAATVSTVSSKPVPVTLDEIERRWSQGHSEVRGRHIIVFMPWPGCSHCTVHKDSILRQCR